MLGMNNAALFHACEPQCGTNKNIHYILFGAYVLVGSK